MELGITFCQFASASDAVLGVHSKMPWNVALVCPQRQGNYLRHRVASLLRGSGEAQESRARKEEWHRLQGVLAWPGDTLESPLHGQGKRDTQAAHASSCSSRQVGQRHWSPTETGELEWRLLSPLLESWSSPNTEVLVRAPALVLVPPAFEFQDCYFCPRPPPN